jgi:hypothetical protein
VAAAESTTCHRSHHRWEPHHHRESHRHLGSLQCHHRKLRRSRSAPPYRRSLEACRRHTLPAQSRSLAPPCRWVRRNRCLRRSTRRSRFRRRCSARSNMPRSWRSSISVHQHEWIRKNTCLRSPGSPSQNTRTDWHRVWIVGSSTTVRVTRSCGGADRDAFLLSKGVAGVADTSATRTQRRAMHVGNCCGPRGSARSAAATSTPAIGMLPPPLFPDEHAKQSMSTSARGQARIL